ncbi:Hypothetical_protein [Hexamita inflata]|uniref:Hypothetical_protein n=1 Tax=Hexamita inflata TaxID=28002 RepID=A0AA86NND2_9EUKA|nr:Hypothetical protein HINF_LOCUS9891 [Hexamita inflata]
MSVSNFSDLILFESISQIRKMKCLSQPFFVKKKLQQVLKTANVNIDDFNNQKQLMQFWIDSQKFNKSQILALLANLSEVDYQLDYPGHSKVIIASDLQKITQECAQIKEQLSICKEQLQVPLQCDFKFNLKPVIVDNTAGRVIDDILGLQFSIQQSKSVPIKTNIVKTQIQPQKYIAYDYLNLLQQSELDVQNKQVQVDLQQKSIQKTDFELKYSQAQLHTTKTDLDALTKQFAVFQHDSKLKIDRLYFEKQDLHQQAQNQHDLNQQLNTQIDNLNDTILNLTKQLNQKTAVQTILNTPVSPKNESNKNQIEQLVQFLNKNAMDLKKAATFEVVKELQKMIFAMRK